MYVKANFHSLLQGNLFEKFACIKYFKWYNIFTPIPPGSLPNNFFSKPSSNNTIGGLGFSITGAHVAPSVSKSCLSLPLSLAVRAKYSKPSFSSGFSSISLLLSSVRLSIWGSRRPLHQRSCRSLPLSLAVRAKYSKPSFSSSFSSISLLLTLSSLPSAAFPGAHVAPSLLEL